MHCAPAVAQAAMGLDTQRRPAQLRQPLDHGPDAPGLRRIFR
jgi:hypothetical protein